MSRTVRTLIRDAYLRSTVRGLGDTPDDHETADALTMLNEILDVLSDKEDFSSGKEVRVFDVPPKGYITFSDNPHRIFRAIADTDSVRCSCGDSHDLEAGESVVVRLGGIDIETAVSSVESFKEFTIPADGRLTGCLVGSFKKSSEPDEFLIDVISKPPVEISQVVGSGEGELTECTEREFYSVEGRSRSWFYRKGNSPYPRLYVMGCTRVRAVWPKPCLRNLGMDADLTWLEPSMYSAILYRLAAEIAATNNFEAVEKRLLERWRNAYATFVRSHGETVELEPDGSMAGYDHGGYDIFSDGAPNAAF